MDEDYTPPEADAPARRAYVLACEVRDLSYLMQILAARAWMHGVEKGVRTLEQAAKGKPTKTTVKNPYAPDFTDG